MCATVEHDALLEHRGGRSSAHQLIDRLRQSVVAIRDPSRVVARQPEVDPVPHAAKLRMVIGLLSMERDARQEGEGLAEILETERADQRSSTFFDAPAFWGLHHISPSAVSPIR